MSAASTGSFGPVRDPRLAGRADAVLLEPAEDLLQPAVHQERRDEWQQHPQHRIPAEARASSLPSRRRGCRRAGRRGRHRLRRPRPSGDHRDRPCRAPFAWLNPHPRLSRVDPLRVAVVGSGPAGFYAASALLASDLPVEVDLIERLPTPWGLVRLGVAPDHPNIKAVSRAFEKTAAQPGFRFFGNVEVGRDVTHDELRGLYDAVVYSVGAQTDRRLGIPGEDLPGSWAATEFVAWYNGHPDFQELEFDLSHERAVVIGNGNVALDVARMLALTPDELAPTDTTDEAIAAINGAGVREILVVGRRGPVQAAWTPVEVGELGELAGADIVVDPADLELDAASAAELEAAPPTVKRNVEHLRDYAARTPAGKPRRIRLRFFASPVAIHGDGQGRGDRARPQRAGRRTGGRDGRARDDPLRDRLPQRRLPRRRPAGRPVRRRLRDDPERGRPGRAGPLRGGLDQARPERRDRDEQEGRDGDDRAAARGRQGGKAPAARRRHARGSARASAAPTRSCTRAGRRSTRPSGAPASLTAGRGSSSAAGTPCSTPRGAPSRFPRTRDGGGDRPRRQESRGVAHRRVSSLRPVASVHPGPAAS